jgi:DNA processing protein
MSACDRCLTRTWLLGRLSGHLDHLRSRIDTALALPDQELIAALAGKDAMEVGEAHARFAPAGAEAARDRARAEGLELVCRCDPRYPSVLEQLEAPPAVLHLAGELRWLAVLDDAVAVVGARRCTPYGREVTQMIAGGLSVAGVPVISGMALGIDSAAHLASLDMHGGPTIAVLPGPAERPYPPGKHGLHGEIVKRGLVISEFAPGTDVRRWCFLARNRIIAGLARVTVVVEAGHHSGALVTARYAADLERRVGAVPGRVTSPQSIGTNELLKSGADLIRGPQDVLDLLFGAGERVAVTDQRAAPVGAQQALLEAISAGAETAGALARSGFELADLAALELGGWIRRGSGGQLTVIP